MLPRRDKNKNKNKNKTRQDKTAVVLGWGEVQEGGSNQCGWLPTHTSLLHLAVLGEVLLIEGSCTAARGVGGGVLGGVGGVLTCAVMRVYVWASLLLLLLLL